MKATLLYIALFLFACNASAQTFAPVGSTWYYSNIESFFMPNQGYEKMETMGDTSIQGKTFRRIARTYFFSSGSSINLPDEFLMLAGDTVFRRADDGNLYVLYNFNVQPGHSWTTKAYDQYAGYEREIIVTVDSMSTTTINGEVLRQLFVVTNDGMSFGSMSFYVGGIITEKLGGWKYMFPQDYGLWDSNIRYGLRCYSDNEIGNYTSGTSPSCTHLVTSRNDALPSSGLSLFPNPTKSDFKIDLGTSPERKEVRVYNSAGKLVRQQTLSGNETQASITLNTSGIYLCQVIINNSVTISERVVVE